MKETERSVASLALAGLFLRLGLTAFGGPAAHIAMMRSEVVDRHQWMSSEEFLDMMGVASLLPGPSSTELAILLGHRLGGSRGLLITGLCFVLPAAGLTLALAWAYVRFGHLPAKSGFMTGVKPIIIAIVLQALWTLGRTALKSPPLVVMAALSVAAGVWGVNALAILLGGGVLALAVRRGRASQIAPASVGLHAGAVVAGSTSVGLMPLFLVFFKVGALLFGSGYVLLAFLRQDLVVAHHWLSESQLIDAVAVGQVTPGPLSSTATFVGYLLGNVPGAAVATLAIFLPSFVYTILSAPLIPRLRSSSASAFLDGTNAAALGLMAVVTFQLGQAALIGVPTAALFVVSTLVLFRLSVNSAWLILGGGVLGLLWQG